MFRPVAGLVLACLLLTGCNPANPPISGPTEVPTVRPTASPGPTLTAGLSPTVITPSPAQLTPVPAATTVPSPTVEGPSEGCVDGWLGPLPGSPEFDEGIDILSGYMGIDGPWTVDEMRYFTGPDVPWIIEPHYEVVERWYVRAALVEDPDFRGRFLLEKRTDRIKGVSAVAPWETSGYASPDWHGFVGDGPPTSYTGLPGYWTGINYDFVTGEGDTGQPGLPEEVVGCLAGT